MQFCISDCTVRKRVQNPSGYPRSRGLPLLKRLVDVPDKVADIGAPVQQRDHVLPGFVLACLVTAIQGGVPLRPAWL